MEISMTYQKAGGQVCPVNPSWINISGLPEDSYLLQRLHTIRPRKDVAGLEDAVKAIKSLVCGEMAKPMMLLCSATPGLGKTHLAHAAGWLMLGRGKRVACYQVPVLLDELKAGYDESKKPIEQRVGATYESIMSWLQHAELLILDDIGMENSTGWSVEKLDQIVDYRYSNNLATLLTSNTLAFSARIVSRCKEGAVIMLEGKDYRGSGAQKKTQVGMRSSCAPKNSAECAPEGKTGCTPENEESFNV